MRISEQVQGYVRENSEIVQDQEKYEERYQALVGQYEPPQKQETALAGTASRAVGKTRTDSGLSKSIERTKWDAAGI